MQLPLLLTSRSKVRCRPSWSVNKPLWISTGLFPAIQDIRVKQHIVEGEYVATVFDFDTTFGVIPVFDCFRVSNGKLKQIRPFYDPRPITNPQGS